MGGDRIVGELNLTPVWKFVLAEEHASEKQNAAVNCRRS